VQPGRGAELAVCLWYSWLPWWLVSCVYYHAAVSKRWDVRQRGHQAHLVSLAAHVPHVACPEMRLVCQGRTCAVPEAAQRHARL
jgi:hypothetical protein